MTNQTVDTSLSAIARIAGFSYLFIIIGYTASWTLIYSKLIVAGNVMATADNIRAHELLLRLGIACDLMMVITMIVLSLTHYIMLKPVNKSLALFALSLRLTDAILVAVTLFFSIIAMQFLAGETYLTAFTPEQLRALGGYFVNIRTAAFTVPSVFHCLGFMVFCYLFFRSKYIPRLLAVFGIFSYLPILIYVLTKPATIQLGGSIEFIIYIPSLLFEIIIGLWLLIRGVNVEQQNKLFFKSAST